MEQVSLDSLHTMIKEQGAVPAFIETLFLTCIQFLAQRIRGLEDDNRNLNNTLQSFFEEFNNLRASLGRVCFHI